MARRTHFPTGRRGSGRQTVWIGWQTGTNKVGIGANTAILLSQLTASALALRPFTITRFRGVFIVSTDQIAADEEPQMVVSTGVFSDTAVALGITALPDAISNPDGDWFQYDDLPYGFNKDTDGNVNWLRYAFDSKAQRKVGLDEDIAMIGANNSAVDGGQLIGLGRMLLKLH